MHRRLHLVHPKTDTSLTALHSPSFSDPALHISLQPHCQPTSQTHLTSPTPVIRRPTLKSALLQPTSLHPSHSTRPGYYCASGASAPLPCPGGTHQNTSLVVMTGVEQCVTCGEGTYCSVGAGVPTACAPGTFTPIARQASCASCGAGSYQDESGGTACKQCTAGYHCASGASAPLPCPGGTHQNTSLAVMTGVEQCVTCGEGTYCSVGAGVPIDCAPGTFNPIAGQASCGSCEAGAYQDESGTTGCKLCTAGYYCASGASAQLP